MHITKGKEISTGIPLSKTKEWGNDNQVLDSDQIEIIEEDVEDEIEDQTLQNIEETIMKQKNVDGTYGIEARIMLGSWNIRDFSITCSTYEVVNHLHMVYLEHNKKWGLERVYEWQEMWYLCEEGHMNEAAPSSNGRPWPCPIW